MLIPAVIAGGTTILDTYIMKHKIVPQLNEERNGTKSALDRNHSKSSLLSSFTKVSGKCIMIAGSAAAACKAELDQTCIQLIRLADYS